MQIWVKRVEEIKLIDQKEGQTFISKIAKVYLHISQFHIFLFICACIMNFYSRYFFRLLAESWINR